MVVFRIALEKYALLTSSGSANRWNKAGEYVIYTGGSRSLSTLELVVHRGSITSTKIYKVMQIYIKDEPGIVTEIDVKSLPANWRDISAYGLLQSLGSNWYSKNTSLVLKVPSAIIPQEYNYIINTKHSLFSTVKLIDTENYFWDDRLI